MPARNEERGDQSFWLILPGFFIAMYGAPVEYLFLPEILPQQSWLKFAGLLLVGLSIALHGWARSAIRGQFSGHVQIQQKHQLVVYGPYRFVRPRVTVPTC